MLVQQCNVIFNYNNNNTNTKNREISIMINHNPYNLPERPPIKQQPRILTQANNTSHYRKNDSLEHAPNYQNYPPRPHPMHLNPTVHLIKKSTSPVDKVPIDFYVPPYPPQQPQKKRLMSSSKSQHTSSAVNLANLMANNSPRASFGASNVPSKREKISMHAELNESLGISYPEFKELSDKVESLNMSLLKNQQRVQQLQKASGLINSSFLPSHSSVSRQSEQQKLHFSTECSSQAFQKLQKSWKQQLRGLKNQIENIKQDCIAFRVHPSQIDQIVNEKIKHSIPNLNFGEIDHKMQAFFVNKLQYRLEEDNRKLKNEMKFLQNQLEDNIHRNHDFLTSVIARLERQIGNKLHFSPNSQNTFKSSALKCSGSAILLRFVQSFRVRKNNNAKNSEVKICLTDNTYYIDQDGYLLDKQQHYLVDDRGYQVKLEEQHIALLKEANVLQ